MTYKNCPEYYLKELKARGRWYCKGFTALVTGVIGASELYIQNKDSFTKTEKEELKAMAYDNIELIQELYNNIPLEELKKDNDPDLEVLTKIKAEIPLMSAEVKLIFEEGKKSMAEISIHEKNIRTYGKEYDAKLIELRDKIRSYPHFQKWGFKSTDYQDRYWDCLF